jgi:Predicted esterase
VIFVLLFLTGFFSKAEAGYYCNRQTLDEKSFRYCISEGNRRTTQDIIFFFHGMGRSERSYFQDCDTQKLQRRMHEAGYYPTVITFSMGKEWILSEKKNTSSIKFFTHRVIPYLEAKVGGLRNGQRILVGKSMGGFNAAVVGLKQPDYFSKVALLCPAFSTVSPFGSRTDIWSYIRRTFAVLFLVNKALDVARAAFADNNEYKKNDPLKLVNSFDGRVKPKLFVSCGQQDFFGFQEGSKVFARAAEKKNFDVQYRPVMGGHCTFNKRATAHFIMED